MNDYQGIVPNLDEAIYHARPELSSTEARLLLQSPKKYRWRKDNPPLMKQIPEFTVGAAIHALVLGEGALPKIIPTELLASNGAVSTKAAKDWIAEVEDAGERWMKQADYDEVTQIAEAVLSDPLARELLERPGLREASIFASDPATGVAARGRFDFLPDKGPGRRIAVDLKSTVDASPKAFTKSVVNFEYSIQRAWYLDLLQWATGDEGEMVFVAVEKEPPYLVAVHQLDKQWRDIGHVKAARARELYAEYTASGVWPNWPGDEGGVHMLTAPNFYLWEYEETFDA